MSEEIILVLALIAETLLYCYVLFNNIEQKKYIDRLEKELSLSEHEGKTFKKTIKKTIRAG